MTSKESVPQKNSGELKLSTNFEQEKTTSSTLKRNPKMELNKTDLLKLLSYLEGELQARDIVIATLKAEKVKRLLSPGRFWLNSSSDPRAALQRDAFGGAEPVFDEDSMQSLADRQMVALDNYVSQHRRMVANIAKLMKEMEDRRNKVIQDLEEEKRKHEHDTAQGDDITYGLEKERTRLRQELELEKSGRKKAEKDLKKFLDMFDEEKARTKSIVLLLIAERKKALIKYVEERKRSEDLAQILAEEKARIDAMAEGLEEESKKSLQMEAELERQMAEFEAERQVLRATLAKEEKRFKELEAEAERHRSEADSLKKQLVEAHHVAMFQAGATPGLCPRPPHPPAKPTILPSQGAGSPRPTFPQSGIPQLSTKVVWGAGTATDGSVSPPPSAMLSSVAKVVQPTATVSSVPVSAPTTGIARSVSPGQSVRTNAFPSAFAGSPQPSPNSQQGANWSPEQTAAAQMIPPKPGLTSQPTAASTRVALQAAPGTKVFAAATSEGSKFSFRVGATAAEAGQSTVKKAVGSRGFPPPIPPNKPVVPPKKEGIRRAEAEAKSATEPITIKYKVVHCPEVHEDESPRREPQETCS